MIIFFPILFYKELETEFHGTEYSSWQNKYTVYITMKFSHCKRFEVLAFEQTHLDAREAAL